MLAFSGVYGVCNRMRDGDCGFPVRQNKSDFSLEVRNHRAFRLRGVCLPKQPVQSAQHRHATEPWFCLRACIVYNAVCWLITAAAYYPATHAVRTMVEDDNFAQTWYVFWVLPLMFIALNLFMIPIYPTTLYTGRMLQGYIVLSIALLVLLFVFNTI